MRITQWNSLACLLLCALYGCTGSSGANLPKEHAQRDAPPGTFQVLAVNDYRCFTNFVGGGSPDLQGAPFGFASDLTTGLTTGAQQAARLPWTVLPQKNDGNATPGSFTQNAGSIDALFYAGHGAPGLAVLDANCGSWWGTGNNSFGYGSNTQGLPVIGRLKWIFFASSTSVTPDPNNFWGKSDTPGYDPKYASDMRPFFRFSPSSPGSLHGIYGAWQGPGTCDPNVAGTIPSPSNATRICDFNTNVMKNLGKPLAAYLWKNSSPLIVHDAWFNAMADAGFVVGTTSLEDADTRHDTFTSGGGYNPNPAGADYVFAYVQGTGNGSTTSPQSITVNPDTFTLNPVSIVAEPINEPYQINRAQAYEGDPISTVNDGQTTTAFTTEGMAAYHDYGASGAMVMVGPMQRNPVQFDEATAYNAATTFITNQLGMPSDAALASVANLMESFEDGSVMQTGYVFTFLHQNSGFYGGDGIRVRVDDALVPSQGPCDSWAYDTETMPNGRTHTYQYCESYSTIYTDTVNVSYGYRLWRTPGGTRQLQSVGRSTGQQSIDARTASYSLPAGATITSYSAGYWTSGVAGSVNDGAQPAWIFTLGSDGIAGVDAFSGAYLGATTL